MTVYAEFWRALEARDWERFRATVSADVAVEWPMSGERLTGREALVRFMAEFPGDWHLSMVEEHADAAGAATRVEFVVGAERSVGLSFFTAGADGTIAAIREFWPEPYEPPPGRGHLVERFRSPYA